MVHVEPASHVAVQLPPEHWTLHIAPAAHVVSHFPAVHCSVQSLPAANVVGHPLAAVTGQSRLQSPLTGQLQLVPSHRPAPPGGVGGGVPPSPDEPPSGVPLPTVQS